jgi:hypothetical protein
LVDGRWTAILDGEFVMIVKRSACESLSAKIDGEVFGFLAGGTSGTYALYRYSKLGGRELFVQEGEILKDEGSPLPEEHGINKSEISETDLMSICEAKGFSPELFQSSEKDIILVELAEPRKPRPQIDPKKAFSPPPSPPQNIAPKKSWWSFFLRS